MWGGTSSPASLVPQSSRFVIRCDSIQRNQSSLPPSPPARENRYCLRLYLQTCSTSTRGRSEAQARGSRFKGYVASWARFQNPERSTHLRQRRAIEFIKLKIQTILVYNYISVSPVHMHTCSALSLTSSKKNSYVHTWFRKYGLFVYYVILSCHEVISWQRVNNIDAMCEEGVKCNAHPSYLLSNRRQEG